MTDIRIKYATYLKAVPPRPTRLAAGGWGGPPQKMEDGSEPQPWHCLPFVEGSTYGLELVYPYETECRVVNDAGAVRFDHDYAAEPGGGLTGGEFMRFAPDHAAKFYLFNARVDLQPPPGYVLRTEPHPRFFTDDTGTVPLAMVGHVQSHWWPRKLFVVFKVPPPGGVHVFRKGEPYAQVLFVPQRAGYELVPMSPDEEAQRRRLERAVDEAKGSIATNAWRNPDGTPFNNHYKVLAGAYAKDGHAGVDAATKAASERSAPPANRPVAESLAAGRALLAQERYIEARNAYAHVLSVEPDNAEALSNMGIAAACLGGPAVGLQMMARAVALEPNVAAHHNNLGELLRMMERPREAEAAFRASLRINPRDAGVLGVLGLTLAQQGRAAEGLEACRAAVAANPASPLAHFRTGTLHRLAGDVARARASFEAALAADPKFAPATRALRELPAAGG